MSPFPMTVGQMSTENTLVAGGSLTHLTHGARAVQRFCTNHTYAYHTQRSTLFNGPKTLSNVPVSVGNLDPRLIGLHCFLGRTRVCQSPIQRSSPSVQPS